MAAPTVKKPTITTKTSVFQPGAAPYGNFINYYSFNHPDKRIQFIPRNLLEHVVCSTVSTESVVTIFDMGCNSGDLTVSLYEHLAMPIKNSKPATEESNMQLKSAQEPTNMDRFCCTKDKTQCHTPCLCNSQCMSPIKSSDKEIPQKTALSRRVYMLGCDIDSILIQRAKEANPYPDNIVFCEADIMGGEEFKQLTTTFLEDHSSSIFDLTTCFSVTMWIHLHHGDKALLTFLREISRRTRFLMIEPQPWKCYKSAVRRVKKLGQRVQWLGFDQLSIKVDVVEQIENYLVTECNMDIVQFLGETEWNRRLLLLRNCKQD